MTLARSDMALCLTCGMPVDAAASVVCPRCDAPQHADCASYYAGCPRYACEAAAPPS